MSPSTTTHGITTTNSDVKLTVLAGGLTIGELTSTADDITLGAGHLTMPVTFNVTQPSANVVTAAGLQLLGSGSVHLDEPANNVATLAAFFFNDTATTEIYTLSLHDALPTSMSPSTTTHGITTTNSDVKLTVLAGGLTIGELTSTADDI